MTALAKFGLASLLSTALLGSLAGAVSTVPSDFESIARRRPALEQQRLPAEEEAPATAGTPVSSRLDAGVLPSS
jgi:hypothetical protein